MAACFFFVSMGIEGLGDPYTKQEGVRDWAPLYNVWENEGLVLLYKTHGGMRDWAPYITHGGVRDWAPLYNAWVLIFNMFH